MQYDKWYDVDIGYYKMRNLAVKYYAQTDKATVVAT